MSEFTINQSKFNEHENIDICICFNNLPKPRIYSTRHRHLTKISLKNLNIVEEYLTKN